MPRNPGNTGQSGYKMRKVVSIVPEGQKVKINLECGHYFLTDPYRGRTPEEWAATLRQDMIGARQRCEKCRQP